MNIKLFGPAVIILAVIVVSLLGRETSVVKTNSTARTDCAGMTYNGAWFDVIVPENFIVKPSLPSTTGDGYESVWFINSGLDLTLYIYSPQWGGKPSDIFDDSSVAKLSEHTESNEKSSVHTRTVVYNDGKYGSFTSTETVDYISHLTTGYKSNHTSLPKELEQIYSCFVESIQQFTD